jgi:flagellar biosynthesis protein FliQ
MNVDLALHILTNLFWTGLTVCSPVLIVAMLVGLIVSMLQVVTQIQEMSLTFVPKLFAVSVVLMLTGSWMISKISQFSIQLWSGIPSMF